MINGFSFLVYKTYPNLWLLNHPYFSTLKEPSGGQLWSFSAQMGNFFRFLPIFWTFSVFCPYGQLFSFSPHMGNFWLDVTFWTPKAIYQSTWRLFSQNTNRFLQNVEFRNLAKFGGKSELWIKHQKKVIPFSWSIKEILGNHSHERSYWIRSKINFDEISKNTFLGSNWDFPSNWIENGLSE